jgi:hypothetical protein
LLVLNFQVSFQEFDQAFVDFSILFVEQEKRDLKQFFQETRVHLGVFHNIVEGLQGVGLHEGRLAGKTGHHAIHHILGSKNLYETFKQQLTLFARFFVRESLSCNHLWQELQTCDLLVLFQQRQRAMDQS